MALPHAQQEEQVLSELSTPSHSTRQPQVYTSTRSACHSTSYLSHCCCRIAVASVSTLANAHTLVAGLKPRPRCTTHLPAYTSHTQWHSYVARLAVGVLYSRSVHRTIWLWWSNDAPFTSSHTHILPTHRPHRLRRQLPLLLTTARPPLTPASTPLTTIRLPNVTSASALATQRKQVSLTASLSARAAQRPTQPAGRRP